MLNTNSLSFSGLIAEFDLVLKNLEMGQHCKKIIWDLRDGAVYTFKWEVGCLPRKQIPRK